jgi:hypothetical protein
MHESFQSTLSLLPRRGGTKVFETQHAKVIPEAMNLQMLLSKRAILECFAPELAELSESFDKHHPMPIEDVDPQTFQLMLGHVYGISLDTIDWKSQATYLLEPAKKTESRRQIRLHHSQGRSRSMVSQIPQS